MDPTEIQPPPMPGHASVWRKAIEFVYANQLETARLGLIASWLMIRRDLGIARYGTELQSHNGRNAIADAIQELLDSIMYITQAFIEETIPARLASNQINIIVGIIFQLHDMSTNNAE